MSALPPRALRNCALSALLAVVVRPLNFTVTRHDIGAFTMVDAAEESRLLREQTRLAWRVAIPCSTAAAALGIAALRRGTVLGLHMDAVSALPFTLGLAGFLAYIARRALVTGVVLSRGGIIERRTRPRAFYLSVAFMVALAVVFIVITVALIHFDPRRSRVG